MESLSSNEAGGLRRAAVLGFGVVSYLVFFASFLYAIGFIGNFGVPTTLDGAPQVSWPIALATNLGLLVAFALQHSVMARPAFKKWWTQFVPVEIERSVYVLFSSLALIAMFIWWQPLGGVIWQVESHAGQIALYGAYGLGWCVVLWTTFLINHFDLFGLRQVWLAFKNQPYSELKFVTPWVYSVIRHPLYFGWLMVIWFTPTMTAAHLLFAVIVTAYIFVGIRLEEKDLRDAHPDYAEYQKQVPMLVPQVRRYAAALFSVVPQLIMVSASRRYARRQRMMFVTRIRF